MALNIFLFGGNTNGPSKLRKHLFCNKGFIMTPSNHKLFPSHCLFLLFNLAELFFVTLSTPLFRLAGQLIKYLHHFFCNSRHDRNRNSISKLMIHARSTNRHIELFWKSL